MRWAGWMIPSAVDGSVAMVPTGMALLGDARRCDGGLPRAEATTATTRVSAGGGRATDRMVAMTPRWSGRRRRRRRGRRRRRRRSTTEGPPGDVDVEAPAARATDCRRRLPATGSDESGPGRTTEATGRDDDVVRRRERADEAPAGDEGGRVGGFGVVFGGGGAWRLSSTGRRQAAMATGSGGSGGGSGTCGGSDGRRRLRWRRPAMEERERAAAATEPRMFSLTTYLRGQ